MGISEDTRPGASEGRAALPRRVHHVGVTVSDLDRSIAFYRDLFGAEPLFVNDMRSRALARAIGAPATDLRFCMIPLENVVLELIEWRAPEARPAQPGGPAVGAVHVAFEVPDIQAVAAKLRERGARLAAEPHRFGPDDEAPAVVGATFAYFSDPDGLGLEVYQKRDPGGPF
jgi:catechol 2,3-dioxygenase-like lactoylglutathione lyase family enzyme